MIDFLVIGGGIAGISTAARLSALGTVTVLEGEDHLGHHASGRSAAMFEETYGAPAVTALTRASRDHLAGANGGVLSPRGFLMIGDPSNADTFAEDAKTMGLAPITLAEAQDRIPIIDTTRIDRAAYHSDAWDIDTDRLLQDFAKTARANGSTITTGATVTKITRTNQGWDVTAGDTYTAKHLINAAGAWADDIARLAGLAPIGLQPLRRSMARIPAPGGHDVSRWPMLFGPGETWYAKPDAGALLVSPAEEDPTHPHDAWADDMVLAEGLERYAQNVTEPVTRLLSSWAGLRTFAPDRALVLGPAPKDPTFIWCAGQGGYGMQTAPAASQLIADIIAGRAPAIGADAADSLSPRRFAPPT